MARYHIGVTLCVAALLVCSPAYAYVPLGAGLSAIGSVFAVIAAAFLGIVGFIWYPIKRLLQRLRKGSKVSGPE